MTLTAAVVVTALFGTGACPRRTHIHMPSRISARSLHACPLRMHMHMPRAHVTHRVLSSGCLHRWALGLLALAAGGAASCGFEALLTLRWLRHVALVRASGSGGAPLHPRLMEMIIHVHGAVNDAAENPNDASGDGGASASPSTILVSPGLHMLHEGSTRPQSATSQLSMAADAGRAAFAPTDPAAGGGAGCLGGGDDGRPSYLPSHPLHAFCRDAVVDRTLRSGIEALRSRDQASLSGAVQKLTREAMAAQLAVQRVLAEAHVAEAWLGARVPPRQLSACLLAVCGGSLRVFSGGELCNAHVRAAPSTSELLIDGCAPSTLLGALPGLSSPTVSSWAVQLTSAELASGFRLVCKAYEIEALAETPEAARAWVRGINCLPLGAKQRTLIALAHATRLAQPSEWGAPAS